jgi:hypothetical protein
MVERSYPDTELLPCPFCGGRSIDPAFWATADCCGPGCDGCGATAETVEKWNTRAVARKPAYPAIEVLDFLNSIEGAGYGGMASFEIARAHVQDTLGVAQPKQEPVAMLGGIHGVSLVRHIEAMLPAARKEFHTPLYQHPNPFVVSDEDWQCALDCAMECLHPEFTPAHDISRAEMDNAMQHAFGILSLKYEGRRGSPPPLTEPRCTCAAIVNPNIPHARTCPLSSPQSES